MNKAIYLFSSNASKEYLLDVLETLALPRGSIQHFRYQSKWLDPDLSKKIPIKSQTPTPTSQLRRAEVVVCYLYQQEDSEKKKWLWKSIYPIRRGELMYCYKTGDKETDIVHFYFKVTDYYAYDPANRDLSTTFKAAVEEAIGKNERPTEHLYASLGGELKVPLSESSLDESAIYSLAKTLDPEHLKTPAVENSKRYFPVFYFIKGLFDTQDGQTLLEPLYDEVTHKSFYKLKESMRYVLEISYFSPGESPGPNSRILFESIPEHFISSHEKVLNVASRYDEESWLVFPRSLDEKEVWSVLEFKSDIKVPEGSKSEPLNIVRQFDVLINRRPFWRKLFAVLDTFGDAGLAVGTSAITIWSITKDSIWILPAIGGFSAWAILKILVRLWKA